MIDSTTLAAYVLAVGRAGFPAGHSRRTAEPEGRDVLPRLPAEFVHAESGSEVSPLAILGSIVVAMGAAYASIVAFAAGSFGGWLNRNPHIGRRQGTVIGAISIGLGVRLALQDR